MNLTQRIINYLLFSSALLSGYAVYAEEELTTYQVEMIVFEQPLYEFSDNEIFKQGVLIPDTETAKEIPPQQTNTESETQSEHGSATNLPQNTEPQIQDAEDKTDAEKNNQLQLTADNLVPADPSQLKLEKIRQSIEKSSSYRLISYQSWQQLGQDDKHAFNIHVSAGFPFVVIYNADNNTEQKAMAVDYSELMDQWTIYKETLPITSNLNEQIDNLAEEEQESKVQEISLPDDLLSYLESLGKKAKIVYELDGTVKLVRTRFLHFYTNLIWNVQLDPTIAPLSDRSESAEKSDDISLIDDMETEEPVIASVLDKYNDDEENTSTRDDEFLSSLATLNIQSYPFISHRKMKSRQQHYIDHPKIGLIITVTPIVKTEKHEQEGEGN